ncbi:MAG TPA: glycosyltransferase [Acidimicrobiales bacterium]|nr:glycosyltransferase [Acidimicrobiales bacterium]
MFPLEPTRFDDVLKRAQAVTFARDLKLAAEELRGHTLWHVNSTATGGGVAEMLQSVLGYLQGGGVSTRWAVIDGDDEFFVVTKRIHHFLHGSKGDGGELGADERSALLSTLDRQAAALRELVQPGDVVILHDPQTVGFAPMLRGMGVPVIWSCHIGTDDPNEVTQQGWDFCMPFVQAADRVVFSRGSYVWNALDPQKVEIIPPCIDAFSPKNQWLEPDTVAAILSHSGIVPASPGMGVAPATFHRQDGISGTVYAEARMIEEQPIDPLARVVTQISRWDPLKDHQGLMDGFARFVPERLNAHLVLAGPSPDSVTDDPEGAETLDDLQVAWRQLPPESRGRVHIACLPMADVEENAAIVNSLQRRSQVIVQKSLAEGFGLTVAEAMWKEAPTVASAVGGIQDQIENGVSGILIDDPHDLAGFGEALTSLLGDPDRANALGRAAHESVRDRYLAPCYLARFLELALAVH